jgi:hypothetical protein
MATLTSAPAIGYVNRASGKTITATTAATGYPASNLNNSRLSSSWRSTALTAQDLIADLTTSQDIDVLALIGYNGEDDAQARFRTSEASNLSSPEYDSGTISAYDVTYAAKLSDTPVWGRHTINFPGTTKNSRYAGITVTDAGNPDTYQKGSVFWAGPVWQPPKAMAFDSEPTFEPVGSPGVERAILGWRMVLRFLTEQDSRELLSILRNKLRSGRYLIVPRPLETKTFLHEAIYATLASGPKRTPLPTFPVKWQVEIEFREVED